MTDRHYQPSADIGPFLNHLPGEECLVQPFSTLSRAISTLCVRAEGYADKKLGGHLDVPKNQEKYCFCNYGLNLS